MKTVKLTAILVVSGLALLFAACSETESVDEAMEQAKSAEIAESQGIAADSCTYDGELTEAEIAGLLLMREEEKLAHDVYSVFYAKYGEVIFQNIAKSEAMHSSAVLTLLEAYGIEDPALEGEGEFSNIDLADLYTALIAQGSDSLIAALKVGATIEDLDIYDLTELLDENENEDVDRVYNNLLKGSENHMRAFTNVLTRFDETYVPVYISEEAYAAILSAENTSKGNGAGNKGKGKGNSNSGAGDCDGTGAGVSNGTQSGSADGTQSGSKSQTQNRNQTGSGDANSIGNSSGNKGSNGNGNS